MPIDPNLIVQAGLLPGQALSKVPTNLETMGQAMQAGLGMEQMRAAQEMSKERARLASVRDTVAKALSTPGAFDEQGAPTAATTQALLRADPTGATLKGIFELIKERRLAGGEQARMAKAYYELDEAKRKQITEQAQNIVKYGPLLGKMSPVKRESTWIQITAGTPWEGQPYSPDTLSEAHARATNWTDTVKQLEKGPLTKVETKTGLVYESYNPVTGVFTPTGKKAPKTESSVSVNMGVPAPGSSLFKQDVEARTQAYIEGRAKRPTGRDFKQDPVGVAAWGEALRRDPTLSDNTIARRESSWKFITEGRGGQSNNAIETVLQHSGKLADVYVRLRDTGNRYLNMGWHLVKDAIGSDPDYQETKDLVEGIGPELAKAYIPTAGTEKDRTGWMDRISPVRPTAERKRNLLTFADMLLSKMDVNEKQFHAAWTGPSAAMAPPSYNISEGTYLALKDMERYIGRPIPKAQKWLRRYEESQGITPASQKGTPVQPSTEAPVVDAAQYKKLDRGAKYRSVAGGRVYTKNEDKS